MATALQQQLVEIQKNSTHQLDLKAQKARHSKSLLFEPRDAATQSFDTIYQVCYEGYEELCMLDARFSQFARNLFSEQSKNEDRTQMTAKENEELDRTVQSFLGLVGGRLLLKPGMKAAEWLVRRFRVQEYSTEAVLLTFLPYHTSHIFPTLLSILPEQLPATFRWLHPYVASLQSPPRHAVLAAAINNQGFFSSFSQYVLRVAGARHHSATLLGFWASITAQAVSGMIDATRSGRETIRRQREEDLLVRVLPILQSALTIKGVPELYLGSCMIMTILATKTSLEDHALDAMLEAVAGFWTPQTLEDGLTCLAVIAEEKQHVSQPKLTTRAIVKAEDAARLLQDLSQRHRVGKLVLGTVLGAIDPATGIDGLAFAKGVARRNLLSEQHTIFLLESVLVRLQASSSADTEPYVAFLSDLSTNARIASLLQQAAREKNVDLHRITPSLVLTLAHDAEKQIEAPANVTEAMDTDEDTQEQSDQLGTLLGALPQLDDKHPSFLDASNDEAFRQYMKAFEASLASEKGQRKFLAYHHLQKNKLAERPTFLSLLTRTWSSSPHAMARVRAFEAAAASLQELSGEAHIDMQVLLPYAICGLADEAQRARKAAAYLCKSLAGLYGVSGSKDKVGKGVRTWSADELYGPEASQVHTLSAQDTYKFLSSAVIPMLEDCVLDGAHAVRDLADALKGAQVPGTRRTGAESKEMKTALRLEACTFLASHAAATPTLQVKLRLLEVLDRADKAASDARKSILLPLVKQWVSVPTTRVEALCSAESVSRMDLDRAVIGSLSHRSADELQTLKAIAVGELGSRLEVSHIAFEHLRHLWSNMKTPSQVALVDFLLDHTIDARDDAPESTSGEALEALRNLHFPTEILVHMVESLPNASDLHDQPPSAKKQRTSKTDSSQPRKVDPAKLNAAVRRITLVLELAEGSKPEQHPRLLKGLFHLLAELQHYKTMTGSQLVYVQGLVMGCLLSVVNGLKDSKAADIDRSVIRADLIVDCVRTASSTQVHNTALLLISSLASWAPELVLHNVMPLFTFMSTTLLRQSDEYSAHVTDQTVARIVPPLAASLKRKGKDLVSGAAELLLSFTAAFEHIPLHRRGGLFQHLVQTLGPEESLFAVVAMLVERYPTDDRVQPFASELMGAFSVNVQVLACNQYLDLVFDTLKPKRTLPDIILGFGEKDADQADDSIETLLEALANLLQNSALRKKIAKEFAKGGVEAESLRTMYAQILDRTMQLTRDIARYYNLKTAAESVLASLLALTPTKDFIESSAQLMQTGSDATRQQVFRSLEGRVAQAKRGDATLQQTFLEVLPNCCVFIQEAQPVETRHAAITCIDQIVERYGKRDRSAVFNAAKVIAGNAALVSKDIGLKIISVLCLASMVGVLEDECIPILPQVLSNTLGYAEEALTLTAGEGGRELQSAAFSFAVSVLDHLPWMFSAQYLDRTLVIAAMSVSQRESSKDVPIGAEHFCSLAARKISAEEIFAAVDRTWVDVTILGREATQRHLKMFRAAIQHHSKATVTKNAQAVFTVLLKAFDLRRGTVEEEDDLSGVFSLVDKIALDATLKLNDATFRPFFIRLIEWATTALPKKDSSGRVLRTTSLYSFAHLFFEQLKSLVTSYASFLLENAASLLKTLGVKDTDERESLAEVLMTLSSSFAHDQDDFWQAPAHFDAIASPLLTQLEKAKVIEVETSIVPTITELATAAASPEHHKAMNTTIMQYMRHQDAAVRLAAVKCERSITQRLNFDWLALLPEMLPFISELQEDDDEDVERETLRWVRQIEEVTGESLEGMLQ